MEGLAGTTGRYGEIETSRARFQLLAEALEQLAAVDARAQILATVLAFARRLVGADGVTIVLREGEECFYAHADSPTGPLWEGQRFPLISCISGWSMLNRQTAIVPDIYKDARIPHAAYRPTFVRSLVMVPVGGRALASVGAYWAEVRVPTAEEIAVLETLARAAGTALERCFADERLRASEQRFRSAFDSTLVGLIFAAPDGRIVASNARLSEICGHPPGALAGTSLFDLAHPDNRQELRELVRKLVGGASGSFQAELRCVHTSGRTAWVRIYMSLMDEGADGPGPQLAASMIDITEEKAVQERLLQAQKLDSIGQLTGGIAHDFNNLLTVINGSMEIIGDQISDKPQLGEIVEAVTLACKQGADLTNRLLAFASRQTLQPVLVRPAAVITGMLSLLRRSLGTDIVLDIAGSSGEATAVIDPVQLESALLNLCVNARDAMPEGGVLSIATSTVFLPDAASGGRTQYVLIAVTDSGTGMSPTVLDRAFEPFFTTKQRGAGTGLGLSMVYGFAKQSRGHVMIESVEGSGTTISLYLPAAQAHGDAPG